jgi:hypothetical protein
MGERLFHFVWLPTFERAAKKLLSEEDRRAIESQLCENLESGQIMKRTGGFRKLRHARPGEGKRGGLRIVYLADERAGFVFMALVYAKGDKATLTREEEDELRTMAAALLSEETQ